MRKLKIILLLIFSINISLSQEYLEVIKINKSITSITDNPIAKSLDNTFIYEIDTINLPFVDDFSSDRFVKYNAKIGDNNVKDTTYYTLWINNAIAPQGFNYMSDTTYTINITDNGNGIITKDSIPQNFTTFTVCDIDNYPIVCNTMNLWPATMIYDSTHTSTSPDYAIEITNYDYTQDSARLHIVSPIDSSTLWIDNYAFRNTSFAINPPTIGIATLDGLNQNGVPYQSSSTSNGLADYLTSKPINLDKDNFGLNYEPNDSIYLSFFYQEGGIGDFPDLSDGDSLVVQFYAPIEKEWISVWRKLPSNDSSFRQAMIPLKESKFLEMGFQFRFINYANLSGGFDNWHIDYVYFNQYRTIGDTNRDDVAVIENITTSIKHYTSVPWNHYKKMIDTIMLDSIKVKQYNNSDQLRLVSDNYLRITHNNNQLLQIQNTNTPSITGKTIFTTGYPFGSFPYVYDTNVNDTFGIFNLKISSFTNPDFIRYNDTLFFQQKFIDYYSYDDGIAEAAYGVEGVSGFKPKIASKLNLTIKDSLKSIYIYFSPNGIDNSNLGFRITVWSNNNGKPGTVLYQNNTIHYPDYNYNLNEFKNYYFDEKIELTQGTYFIGFEQMENGRINIGYDKNINSNGKMYYSNNSNWNLSTFGGTFMIRPAFKYIKDNSLFISNNIDVQNNIDIYPNPTNNMLYIEKEVDIIELYDIKGKKLHQLNNANSINLSEYKSSIYIIRIIDGKNIFTKKVVKN